MLPPPKRRRDNRGQPWASNRGCFEGILWILQTGAAWRFLPDEFPSPSTCWRRLKQWEDKGVWLNAWRTLLGALDEEGLLKFHFKTKRLLGCARLFPLVKTISGN
jgi:transposase